MAAHPGNAQCWCTMVVHLDFPFCGCISLVNPGLANHFSFFNPIIIC